ncbi:hypothetical protein G7066_04425 [Leucobacter coleopterorum]|uniref:Uncharacterized protein n=1 Tax=Leucobacter coleopterorum TaxID=2714933 RepID=A0ABX6JZ79_9MICO|nr:hypothetical protein [Leucobacter coleopterorum]QIM18090.1 hypothetical protein G7066_04425 [Leucobacter coleopterorum]
MQLALRDLTEGISAIVFTVTQVDTAVMDASTVFDTTITATATSSGIVPTDSASTRVVGDLSYRPVKAHSTVIGSSNRDVTYTFDVVTNDATQTGQTFTSWGQRFTDKLPAGAVVTDSFSTIGGTWTTSGDPATGQTMTWERTGTAYGPSTVSMVPGNQRVGITVHYPADAFPEGSRPPTNTVHLDVSDHSGQWESRTNAQTQGPAFGPGTNGQQVAIETNAHFATGQDTALWGNAQWLAQYGVKASYLSSADNEALNTMVVENSSALDADTAVFFEHSDIRRLAVLFNPTLKAANVPYSVEYTTTAGSQWKTYGTGLTTANDLRMNFVPQGSTGWSSDNYNLTQFLPWARP